MLRTELLLGHSVLLASGSHGWLRLRPRVGRFLGVGPEGLVTTGGRGAALEGEVRVGHLVSLPPSSPLQMAATIDMNFQSDLLSIFEENLF